MCVLCTGTCIPWYRVSWCTKRGAPNSGQKNVFGIEEYFDISPKNSGNGYNISIYRILRYRMIGDTKYDITIYRDVSCDTTPDHLETPGVNTNSTKTHYLVAVYSCFFRLCLCPHLGLSSVWHFLSYFCCPSAGHIIGLTVPPANSNLVPSRLGLLPERMFVLFHFSIFFYSFLSFRLFSLISGTWYSLVVAKYLKYIVVDVVGYFRLMICCRDIVDVVYATHIYSSPHQWHVMSCWNAGIQCFQWFGTMMLPDRSFLLNVIIHSVLSMIRAVLLYVVELSGFFGGQNTHFFSPPGTWYWYCYGLANTAPNRSIHTKGAGNTFIYARVVFCPTYAYVLRITLSTPSLS